MSKDFKSVRADFPALTQRVNGKGLVYLDTAATALKPWPVIERIGHFYTYEAANIHRGAHHLANKATEAYEATRKTVAQFLNAKSENEVVFTKGTTESINLVAHSYAAKSLKPGDAILISELEHHANIVPWQIAAKENDLKVLVTRVNDDGSLDLEDFEKKLKQNVKLVCTVHVSNVLGLINPIKKMTQMAHAAGALMLVDAAQSVTYEKLDVQDLNVDFLCFSAHKLFGPYGVGVLFARAEILEKMSPYQGGGSMISTVTLEKSDFQDAPFRFEAGTPNISGVVAFKPAVDYFSQLNLEQLQTHESQLLSVAAAKLQEFGGVQVLGSLTQKRAGILSMSFSDMHASDVGQILDQEGVAVRVGHLCTQPLLARFKATSLLRASFSIYNNENDVTRFMEALQKARSMLV